MADFVTSKEDVIKNIHTLLGYKDGDPSEKKFHNDLIRRGKLFVACKYKDKYAFAPSRFAGYQANSKRRHEELSHERDGRRTNPVLDKIFGLRLDKKPNDIKRYNAVDAEFERYCVINDIEPNKAANPRRYWITSVIDFHSALDHDGGSQWNHDNAIDDIGADHATAEEYQGVRYSRDPAIRSRVMARSRGRCEYCNEMGFLDSNDKPYLECHHIIALARDGADRMSNVIALCPNDHREAHFGKRRFEIEKEMIQKIAKLRRAKAA